MYKSNHNDSIEDFKAAFICVNESSKGFLSSPTKLLKALQLCGRNPSEIMIENYWNKYRSKFIEKINFYKNYFKVINIETFCKIADKEKVTTEDELLAAFKNFDLNSDGFLTLQEFNEIFKSTDKNKAKIFHDFYKTIQFTNKDFEIIEKFKHGNEIQNEEIRRLLEEADIDKNQKLNYKELVELILKTIDNAKKTAKKKMKIITQFEKEKNASASNKDSYYCSNDHLKNKIDSTNENFSDNDNDILNKEENDIKLNDNNKSKKQIVLKKKVIKDSKILDEYEFKVDRSLFEKKTQYPKNYTKWLSKSTKGGFYFNVNINRIIANSFAIDLKHSSTMFFTIETVKTPLHKNNELDNMDVSLFIIKDDPSLSIKSFTETKIENKSSAKVHLTSGRYFLFPFTTGCHLKKRDNKRTNVELFKKDLRGNIALSEKFRDALSIAFDLVDLDSNGKLSQDELNLYSFITSNEEIPDKEWQFLDELVGLENNELTKESFIKLNAIEANREDKDEEEFIEQLTNLGFNRSLEIDQSCPFVINIYSEESDFEILLSEIYEIKSSEIFLNQILRSKCFSYSIKNASNVNLLIYHNFFWSAILVENSSNENATIQIDCSNSDNCISNSNSYIKTIQIKPKKNKIAMFLTNLDKENDLTIRCVPSIMN